MSSKSNRITSAETRAAGTAVHRLFLIRHGQYEKARDRLETLTAVGRKQARLTAAALRAEDLTTADWFHSSLPRAKETATLIGQALRVKRLRSSSGLWECRPVLLAEEFRRKAH